MSGWYKIKTSKRSNTTSTKCVRTRSRSDEVIPLTRWDVVVGLIFCEIPMQMLKLFNSLKPKMPIALEFYWGDFSFACLLLTLKSFNPQRAPPKTFSSDRLWVHHFSFDRFLLLPFTVNNITDHHTSGWPRMSWFWAYVKKCAQSMQKTSKNVSVK